MNACDESLICLTYHHGVHWGYYSPSFFFLCWYTFLFFIRISISQRTRVISSICLWTVLLWYSKCYMPWCFCTFQAAGHQNQGLILESKVLTKVWLLRYEVSTRLLFKVEWTLKQLTCLQIYISTHHRKANSVIFTSLKEKKKLCGVYRSKSEFKCWLTLNNRILAGYYVS